MIASTVFGAAKSMALYERVNKLSLLEQYVKEVEDGIRFSGEEQRYLFERLFKQPRFEPLGENFEKLCDTDRKLATEFAKGLGKTDTEGQRLYCRGYAERIGEMKNSAKEEYSQKGRLYKALGVLLGLAAALVCL